MHSDDKITLTLELDKNIAWALAQFCRLSKPDELVRYIEVR